MENKQGFCEPNSIPRTLCKKYLSTNPRKLFLHHLINHLPSRLELFTRYRSQLQEELGVMLILRLLLNPLVELEVETMGKKTSPIDTWVLWKVEGNEHIFQPQCQHGLLLLLIARVHQNLHKNWEVHRVWRLPVGV